MFVTFGEIMMRITPPGPLCFRQALPGPAEITFGGGEANVAVSLALMGNPVRYVTGITPAIGEPAFRATLEAGRKAKAAGAAVACDLNFRKKLWNWRPGG
jgi:sugar/nucleoside kinase (ribokinase family)